jgi:hypothetical protein
VALDLSLWVGKTRVQREIHHKQEVIPKSRTNQRFGYLDAFAQPDTNNTVIYIVSLARLSGAE